MKYPRSILHGYDKATVKLIANALNMPVKSKVKMKKRHLKGVRK